jgi:hypothetical protein
MLLRRQGTGRLQCEASMGKTFLRLSRPIKKKKKNRMVAHAAHLSSAGSANRRTGLDMNMRLYLKNT